MGITQGLADSGQFHHHGRVNRYYATIPIFEQESDTVAQIVNNLGYDLTPTMGTLFGDLFDATKEFYEAEDTQRIDWLANRLNDDRIRQNGIKPDLWLIANIAEAAVQSIRDARNDNPDDFEYLRQTCWTNLPLQGREPGTLEGIYKRARRAASQLFRMERVNQEIAGDSQPMPQNREELVQDG